MPRGCLLYTSLWMLTIVGGPIKYYTYYMIPYIVAENPDIDWKSAMALSKRMTSGHKWRMFLLDLSFIGWDILNAFTFGLLDLFYIVPYKNSVRAQLYQRLREQVIREKCPCWEMLDDRYLFEEPAVIPEGIPSEKIDPELRMLEYPVQLFKIPEEKRREWMEAHYDRPYSCLLYTSILLEKRLSDSCQERERGGENEKKKSYLLHSAVRRSAVFRHICGSGGGAPGNKVHQQ